MRVKLSGFRAGRRSVGHGQDHLPQRKGMAVTRSFGTTVHDFHTLFGALTQYATRAGKKPQSASNDAPITSDRTSAAIAFAIGYILFFCSSESACRACHM